MLDCIMMMVHGKHNGNVNYAEHFDVKTFSLFVREKLYII